LHAIELSEEGMRPDAPAPAAAPVPGTSPVATARPTNIFAAVCGVMEEIVPLCAFVTICL